MVEVTPNRIAQKASDVLARVKDVLVAGTGVDRSKVWIVSMPDDELAEYLAEPGILVRVKAPRPGPTPGGGRLVYPVVRRVEVYRVTMKMLEPGGKDDKAVLAHLDAEDAVASALTLDTTICKLIHWVPGENEILRRVQTNKGLVVSSFVFDLLYVPALPVRRDTEGDSTVPS